MNCHYHPQVEAVGECRLCGTNVCQECMTIVKGNVLCPECVSQVGAKTSNQAKPHSAPEYTNDSARHSGGHQGPVHNGRPLEARSKFLTFLFSFLPGLGHLYLGLTRQGIELMVLFFGVIWLTPWLGGFPFSFLIPIIFFYGIFDALQKRDRLFRGDPVDTDATFFRNMNPEWFQDKKWLGWLIIGLGVLILLKQSKAYFYWHGVDDLLVALLLVGVGVWMLFREKSVRKMPGKNGTMEEENPDA
jgi:hypothetical protein